MTAKVMAGVATAMTLDFDKELDARGLNCPLPILRAKKALTEMTGGQVLRVLSTGPDSVKDFAAFAKQTGSELLSSGEYNKEFEFYLKRKLRTRGRRESSDRPSGWLDCLEN